MLSPSPPLVHLRRHSRLHCHQLPRLQPRLYCRITTTTTLSKSATITTTTSTTTTSIIITTATAAMSPIPRPSFNHHYLSSSLSRFTTRFTRHFFTTMNISSLIIVLSCTARYHGHLSTAFDYTTFADVHCGNCGLLPCIDKSQVPYDRVPTTQDLSLDHISKQEQMYNMPSGKSMYRGIFILGSNPVLKRD